MSAYTARTWHDRCTHARVHVCVHACMHEDQSDARTNRRAGGRAGGLADGRTGGRTDGRTDRMEEQERRKRANQWVVLVEGIHATHTRACNTLARYMPHMHQPVALKQQFAGDYDGSSTDSDDGTDEAQMTMTMKSADSV